MKKFPKIAWNFDKIFPCFLFTPKSHLLIMKKCVPEPMKPRLICKKWANLIKDDNYNTN